MQSQKNKNVEFKCNKFVFEVNTKQLNYLHPFLPPTSLLYTSFLIISVWILLLLQSAGPAKEEKKKKGKKDKKPQTEIKMRGHIPDKLKISSDKGAKEQSDGMVVSGKYLLLELHSPKIPPVVEDE